jgi:DNA-binding transcriptional LysR family regulator
MEKIMTLDQLRYFLEAAKFEHVGKAASSLNISPGSVSTAIMALEDEMKCQLFKREGKRIYLNSNGKYLMSQSEEIFEKLNSVRSRLQGSNAEIQGHYRLGASHFLAGRFLTEAWTRLQVDNHQVTGEICAMSTVTVLSDVLRGTLDFGMCFSPQTHPDLEETRVYSGQLRLAVRKSHPLLSRKGKGFNLVELSDFPATIHKSAAGIDICETHPNFEKYGIKPKITLQFDSDDLAIRNLEDSDSWSLLPDIVLRDSKRLNEIPHPRAWNAPYTIALVRRRKGLESVIFSILRRNVEMLL